jgi:hypothetical protein
MVLRVWVVVPPILAAEADDGFPCEDWQLSEAFYADFAFVII